MFKKRKLKLYDNVNIKELYLTDTEFCFVKELLVTKLNVQYNFHLSLENIIKYTFVLVISIIRYTYMQQVNIKVWQPNNVSKKYITIHNKFVGIDKKYMPRTRILSFLFNDWNTKRLGCAGLTYWFCHMDTTDCFFFAFC